MRWVAIIIPGVLAAGVLALAWMIPVRGSDSIADDTLHMIPYDLGAQLADDGSVVDLTWTRIEAEDVSVVVQRSRDGGGTWTDLQELPPGATSHRDADLGVWSRYLYRLRTFDGKGGEGVSGVVSVQRKLP